jgi:hypothetical protein
MRLLRRAIAWLRSSTSDGFGWSDAVVGLGIGIPAAECARMTAAPSA